MSQTQIPSNVLQWLEQRGINKDVVDAFNLMWDNNTQRIIIPIYNKRGEFLFNKYRRNPFFEDQTITTATEVVNNPKYTYDRGGSVQLFGIDSLAHMPHVVICEGEFDAMVLYAQGFFGVSSTGGSASFQEEWGPLFDGKEVYICYDNDDAGVKGALHVQSIIPHAKIIKLPKEVGEHGDITDYFTKLGKDRYDFIKLMQSAKQFRVPKMLKELPKTKKELSDIIKQDSEYCDELLVRQRTEQDPYIAILMSYLASRIESNKHHLKWKYDTAKRKTQYQDSDDRLKQAKHIPIDTLIEFDRNGFARCIWHDEKTPSMHYHKTVNKVKCFGCDKFCDPIDVVMQLKKCSMKEAIDYLLK